MSRDKINEENAEGHAMTKHVLGLDWCDTGYQARSMATHAAALNKEVQKLRAASFVPGKMHCAKCKFSMQRINLGLLDGSYTAGDNKPEPCPNGCGPLWPVTWEQEAREMYEDNQRFFWQMHGQKNELIDILEAIAVDFNAEHEDGNGTMAQHCVKDIRNAWVDHYNPLIAKIVKDRGPKEEG